MRSAQCTQASSWLGVSVWCGGYCGLGGSKCVWYGTVITATGHIRGCGAYGDRHDTLPPGIQVYQQETAKYGTAGYKAYQAPLHTLSPPN